MLGAYIRNAPPRAYNTTVSVLVFQTGYVGSIPTRRSKRFLSNSISCAAILCIVAQLVERLILQEVAGSSPVIKGILTFWPRRITGLVR